MVHTVSGGCWEHPDEENVSEATSIEKEKMECHIHTVEEIDL